MAPPANLDCNSRSYYFGISGLEIDSPSRSDVVAAPPSPVQVFSPN